MLLLALALLAASAAASPLGAARHTLASALFPATQLRYTTNSGVCETTPGVGQMSGYVDIGPSMSLWFWFFEARTGADTAPFTLWLNGGPGCSSMIGLFQENGPCTVNADGKSTTLNPHSWNAVSNMIYIDQPVGVGFSYGTDTVNSTAAAAPAVWQAFQVLFESPQFEAYQSREFILATESYGGHFGPAFVTYFDAQNALIDKGAVQGVKITTSALMINNGWYDPLLQNEAYLTFATDAPGYGPLVDAATLKQMQAAWSGAGGCEAQEKACYAAGTGSASNSVCSKADDYCSDNLFSPAVGNRDSDDLRQNASAAFPPEYYVKYLQQSAVQKAIGAQVRYSECPDAPYELFAKTGDDARTWLPQLAALADSKLKILIWAGDADINCNWLGGHAAVLAMDWYGNATLHATPLANITLGGTTIAAVQNVDNFSFARVYASGHEVPAFQPAAALEIFSQVVRGEQLHSA